MTLGPRAKLLLLASLFLLPIAASIIAYRYAPSAPTANYGELLLPPAQATVFTDISGRWALVASDSGACEAACRQKLTAMRQVRLALGRNASRVASVFVVDDVRSPDAQSLAEFEGMVIAKTPRGMTLPPGAANDRAHIYLVDPHGNVMMRWPAQPELRRMHRDLERLLKASQIG